MLPPLRRMPSWQAPRSTTLSSKAVVQTRASRTWQGNALAANLTWSFTTGAAVGSSVSIWPSSATPAVLSDPETSSVELGVKFRSDVAGYITGIRFYKGPNNTGIHTGTLWTSSGQALASATFTNESATGWQQVTFAAPVAIAANTVYVASYFAPSGGYSFNNSYFATSGADNGVLHAPSSPAAGGNGVYAYGTGGIFPTSTYSAANYWVDVLFATSVGPDTTPPSVVNSAPASGAANIATNAAVTVTFSEPMDPVTIGTSTLELRAPGNVLVPAAVSYSGTTATLIPTSALANTTVYSVTVRGGSTDPRVKDVAGNALAANVSFSFTTAAAGGPCSANPITAENCLTGNPASEWDISGAGDATIQGFATADQRQPRQHRILQGRYERDELPLRHLPHGLLRWPGRSQGSDRQRRRRRCRRISRTA